MIVVGLTGGIASGKSFVIKYLNELKIKTHESDLVVEKIYKKPTINFLKKIQDFGLEKAINKKKISKEVVREIIFNNKNIKEKLEKYIHSIVKKKREVFLKKNNSQRIVFLEIPLLFEKGLENECNYICPAISSIQIREKRALKRPKMTKKIFKLIIKNQTTDLIRKKKSDFLINTSGDKNNTCLQIQSIIYNILNNKS